MAHVYELRTYTAAPGKMDALLARFANHTEALFKRHGLKTTGYWALRDTPGKMLDILEHESVEAAEKNWDAFRADEEWRKVKAETDTPIPLAAKIERVFMDRIDFSKYAR